MQLRAFREHGGHPQEEYAVLLSERLGAKVPFTRSWLAAQENGRNPVEAAVLLAAVVESGLEPEQIVEVVMDALRRISAGDFFEILGDHPRGGYKHAPPRIRDLVETLHQADGAEDEPRARTKIGRQQG